MIIKEVAKRKPSMAFFYDNRFITKGDGRYFSATGFTDSLFSRYLRSFESVTVVARQNGPGSTEEMKRYDLVRNKKVTFKCIDRLSIFNLFFGKDRARVASVVSKNDVSIIRMPSVIGIVATIEAEKQNKPYLIEMVSCPWDTLWNYGKLIYKIIAPVLFVINRIVIYRAPYVIYVSTSFLQKRYPTKGRSLACSDAELSINDRQQLEERLEKIQSYQGISTDIYRFGTVAAVNMKYKGQQYVIKALAHLNHSGYNIEYYLAGSGSSTYLSNLAESLNISDKVHFIGPLPHNEIKDFMRHLDLYIQPSNAESHGRVILEAFETACPAIGSSTGGIPELIDERFIFRTKDVKDLIKKIEIILTKPILLEQAERNFKELQKYDTRILDKKRHDFYAIVAGKTSNVG